MIGLTGMDYESIRRSSYEKMDDFGDHIRSDNGCAVRWRAGDIRYARHPGYLAANLRITADIYVSNNTLEISRAYEAVRIALQSKYGLPDQPNISQVFEMGMSYVGEEWQQRAGRDFGISHGLMIGSGVKWHRIQYFVKTTSTNNNSTNNSI